MVANKNTLHVLMMLMGCANRVLKPVFSKFNGFVVVMSHSGALVLRYDNFFPAVTTELLYSLCMRGITNEYSVCIVDLLHVGQCTVA